MEVKLIKDSKGKEHMVFNKRENDEYNEMGSNVDDFEILQVLGEGSFGFVAKVKSRLNHKIYAMKQMDFSTLKDKKIIKLCENETKLLSKLKHSLITKYYKSIKEGDKLYIIMEFMDNGDLGGMMKASKILEKPIEEEKIYEIFIQAMKSLAYIHSKNLIHRDIKPENLFISIDGTVKLGDFGVSATIVKKNQKSENYINRNDQNQNQNQNQNRSQTQNQNQQNLKVSKLGDIECNQTVVGTPPFMSPEMLFEKNYDLKTDVYSMGVTFFELCYWHFPRVPSMSFDGDVKLIDVPIKNNQNVYSQELLNIIQKMLEKDKLKRPSSAEILELLNIEFNKKYAKNSSIGSVLSCLYAYEELTAYFKKPANSNEISTNSSRKPITFAYLYGINSLTNSISEDWNNSLCRIRNILINENNRYSGNKEIEVRHILSFLLGKMHKELVKKNSDFEKRKSYEIESQNKFQALNSFIISSLNANKSPIFDFFYGLMKTKSSCSHCKETNYSFNYFNFVSFNIDLAQRKQNQLGLVNLFTIQNNILITIDVNKLRYCKQCKSVRAHYQRKQFYSFPPFLVICLDRGYNCQNKARVAYDLNLDLQGNYEFTESPQFFKLIGILKRLDKNEKEHYISLYYDFQCKSWILRDDNSTQKINSPMNHREGTEMIFFYKALKDDKGNYLRRNSSKQVNQMTLSKEFYN